MANVNLGKILSGEALPKIPPDKDPEKDKWRRDVVAYLRRLAGLFTNQNMASDEALRTEMLHGFIETPQAKIYTLIEYAHYDMNIFSLRHKTLSGGCTLALKIDGTTISGTGDTTSSSTQGVYTYAANLVTVGQRVTLVPSGLSSPADLAFTLKIIRSLS